jgi:hypothetical protein
MTPIESFIAGAAGMAFLFWLYAMGHKSATDKIPRAAPHNLLHVAANQTGYSIHTRLDAGWLVQFQALNQYGASENILAAIGQVLDNQATIIQLLQADESAAQKLTADVTAQTKSLSDAVSGAQPPVS